MSGWGSLIKKRTQRGKKSSKLGGKEQYRDIFQLTLNSKKGEKVKENKPSLGNGGATIQGSSGERGVGGREKREKHGTTI